MLTNFATHMLRKEMKNILSTSMILAASLCLSACDINLDDTSDSDLRSPGYYQ